MSIRCHRVDTVKYPQIVQALLSSRTHEYCKGKWARKLGHTGVYIALRGF